MKFWCATAFMNTTELVHIARLLDEAGYHGLMISDHLCYPRDLVSKYPYSPHPDGRPIFVQFPFAPYGIEALWKQVSIGLSRSGTGRGITSRRGARQIGARGRSSPTSGTPPPIGSWCTAI